MPPSPYWLIKKYSPFPLADRFCESELFPFRRSFAALGLRLLLNGVSTVPSIPFARGDLLRRTEFFPPSDLAVRGGPPFAGTRKKTSVPRRGNVLPCLSILSSKIVTASIWGKTPSSPLEGKLRTSRINPSPPIPPKLLLVFSFPSFGVAACLRDLLLFRGRPRRRKNFLL